MDKLKMQTPDLTDKNIERIASLFPNVITETRDESGAVKKAIDFDLLKQSLSKTLVEADDERYRLDWPGKKASLLKANTPITKTLRPCREESVNFDTTENLFIEGDNFEVLKILQESYLGKVKMIYIDPPYNTGNDFIYKDDFAQNKEDYEEVIGIEDEEGGKLFRNTDSNGRFHSDWLSMMYERLVVARDLLRDDGIVFISIDENEHINLKKIAYEIFGEANWVGDIIWKNKFGSGAMTKGFIGVHEYIIAFSKNQIANITRTLNDDDRKEYDKNRDEKYATRGGYVTQPLAVKTFDDRPSLRYPIHYKNTEIWPDKQWIWSKDKLLKAIENNEVVFNVQKDGSYNLRSKKYLIDENGRERRGKPTTFYSDVYTQDGTKDIRSIFENKAIFDFSKPMQLVKYLLSFEINDEADRDYIVLDFFSGSATTAHAVMQLNAEDGENRKFIMVQLPEKTDENSEACKAGYKTIADIGKERIRRAGKKIVEELKAKNQQLELGKDPVDATKLDIGFRVYKTDESNMKDVFYHPSELKQGQLEFVQSNIKEDRTPEDLLTQVLLDLGSGIHWPIEIKKIGKNKVFIVQTNALAACFDNDIDFKIVDTIAGLKPFKVVFKDASFKDDKDRINVEERFKRLSPVTKVTVI